ncbi:PIN domain-containing protein [Pseudomonas sp. 5FOS]|uniref:PIN-like domain-containing protein n=1 Tax=unclassified Pseudomonas TaxID=196821 RepID=UPI002FDF7C2B
MKKAFPGHFANDPADLQRLWNDSLFVMDANVLLNLYRYSDTTRDEFLNIFDRLKDRLWISHQVAKEYLKNRLKVISDQAKLYDAAIDGLRELKASFENSNQHPFVSSSVLGECIRSFDQIVGELEANKAQHGQKINEDDVKARVSQIFDGRVGEPYSSKRLEEIIKLGEVRYENKVPPGFKDAGKGGGKALEDRLGPYGDYIGWLQLLDKAKASNQNVIYVTGDHKEDWWLKLSGKTIGPLPELIDEFVSTVSKQFYMYLPDRFLERAGEFLDQKVSTKAVDEVREANKEASNLVDSVSAAEGPVSRILNAYKTIGSWHLSAATSDLDTRIDESDRSLSPLKSRLKTFRIRLRECDILLERINNERSCRLVDGVSADFQGIDDEALSELYDATKQDQAIFKKLIAEHRYLLNRMPEE